MRMIAETVALHARYHLAVDAAAAAIATARSGRSRRRALQGLGRAGRSTCSAGSASHAGDDRSSQLRRTRRIGAGNGRRIRRVIRSQPQDIRDAASEATLTSSRRRRAARTAAAIPSFAHHPNASAGRPDLRSSGGRNLRVAQNSDPKHPQRESWKLRARSRCQNGA